MKLQKLVPYGKLYARDREYYLISPQPIYLDLWLTENQQAWSVVYAGTESANIDKATQEIYYTPVRQIICSNALIELIAGMKPIQVKTLDDEEEINAALETAEHDPSEPTTEELNTILREFDFEEEYDAENS